MIRDRSIGIRTLCLFSQMVLVTLTFWTWFFACRSESLEDCPIQPYLLGNEFLLIGIVFGTGARRDVDGPKKEWVLANRKSIRQTFVGLFCVFLLFFLLQDVTLSRAFILSYVPWLYVALMVSNYWLPKSLGRLAFSGDHAQRVAVIGTNEKARQFQPWLSRKELVGLCVVGIIHFQSEPQNKAPFPVLGTFAEIGELLRKHAVQQLLVLDLTLGRDRLRQLTHLCEGSGVRLLVLHDLNEYFNHTTRIFEDDGVRFIGLREEPLESPVNRFSKRLLDLAIAVPAVVLILPVSMVVVWMFQRFQSPGPVFFAQTRTGMMGRPFKMIKYRTMHVSNGNEAVQASKGDPRIFPAGRWFRKLSIDELPQFLNVLFGDMSVVGPRPHLAQHDEIFVRVMGQYLIRKFIRPGLTGWAQVNGFRGEIHNENDIQQRVQADIHYLENWSLSLDCLIILKTVRHCAFPPRTAY